VTPDGPTRYREGGWRQYLAMLAYEALELTRAETCLAFEPLDDSCVAYALDGPVDPERRAPAGVAS